MDPSLNKEFGPAFQDFKDVVPRYVKQKAKNALSAVKTIVLPENRAQLKIHSSMSSVELTPPKTNIKLSDIAVKFNILISSALQEIVKKVKNSSNQILLINNANVKKDKPIDASSLGTIEPHDDSPYKVRYSKSHAREALIAKALEDLEQVSTPYLSEESKIRIELYGTIDVGVTGNKFSIASICHDPAGYYVEMEPSPTGGIQELNVNGETYFSPNKYLGKKEPGKVYLHEGENTISMKNPDMVLQFLLPRRAKP